MPFNAHAAFRALHAQKQPGSGQAWDVRDVKVLARPHVDHQRVRASPQRRAQGVRAQALRVGKQVQLRRGRVVGLRARERGIVVCWQRGARDAGRRAARGTASHLRGRRSGLIACGRGARGTWQLRQPRCWRTLERSFTVCMRPCSASSSSRRRLSVCPAPVTTLMASIACSVPTMPGTGPSTPASEQRPHASGRGASGNRQRWHGPAPARSSEPRALRKAQAFCGAQAHRLRRGNRRSGGPPCPAPRRTQAAAVRQHTRR